MLLMSMISDVMEIGSAMVSKTMKCHAHIWKSFETGKSGGLPLSHGVRSDVKSVENNLVGAG